MLVRSLRVMGGVTIFSDLMSAGPGTYKQHTDEAGMVLFNIFVDNMNFVVEVDLVKLSCLWSRFFTTLHLGTIQYRSTSLTSMNNIAVLFC